MTAPTAYLSWSLDIECPACKEEFDLTTNDEDRIVARAIFHNVWEELEGYEAVCINCQHEFKIEKVEY